MIIQLHSQPQKVFPVLIFKREQFLEILSNHWLIYFLVHFYQKLKEDKKLLFLHRHKLSHGHLHVSLFPYFLLQGGFYSSYCQVQCQFVNCYGRVLLFFIHQISCSNSCKMRNYFPFTAFITCTLSPCFTSTRYNPLANLSPKLNVCPACPFDW